jgi:hypothetical protein
MMRWAAVLQCVRPAVLYPTDLSMARHAASSRSHIHSSMHRPDRHGDLHTLSLMHISFRANLGLEATDQEQMLDMCGCYLHTMLCPFQVLSLIHVTFFESKLAAARQQERQSIRDTQWHCRTAHTHYYTAGAVRVWKVLCSIPPAACTFAVAVGPDAVALQGSRRLSSSFSPMCRCLVPSSVTSMRSMHDR